MWSVLPVFASVNVVTPRSATGASHRATSGRAAAFPCIHTPRTRPVPLSKLKYALTRACPGRRRIVSGSPRCARTQPSEPK